MPDRGTVAHAIIRDGNNLPHWKVRKAALTLAGLARDLVAGSLGRVTHGAKAAVTAVGDGIWAIEAAHWRRNRPPMAGPNIGTIGSPIIGPIAGPIIGPIIGPIAGTIGPIPKERISSYAC